MFAKEALPRPMPPVISTLSPLSLGTFLAARGAAPAFTGVSVGGTGATTLFPFYVTEPVIARKMGVINETTVNGNIDLGIFDADLNLVVSSGSVAMSGASVMQEVDITDTQLYPGLYYMGFGNSSETATWLGVALSRAGMDGQEGDGTDAFPLASGVVPDPSGRHFLSTIIVCVAFRTLLA